MDDLLLFTPTNKTCMAELVDLLKALLKNGLKIMVRNVSFFRKELQYMETLFLLNIKEPVYNHKEVD